MCNCNGDKNIMNIDFVALEMGVGLVCKTTFLKLNKTMF